MPIQKFSIPEELTEFSPSKPFMRPFSSGEWEPPPVSVIHQFLDYFNLSYRELAQLVGINERSARRLINGDISFLYSGWRLLLHWGGLIPARENPIANRHELVGHPLRDAAALRWIPKILQLLASRPQRMFLTLILPDETHYVVDEREGEELLRLATHPFSDLRAFFASSGLEGEKEILSDAAAERDFLGFADDYMVFAIDAQHHADYDLSIGIPFTLLVDGEEPTPHDSSSLKG